MSSTQISDVEVDIPPRPEYVGVVRHLMGAVARLGQHSPEFVENAKLAASEATTNAVLLSGRAGVDDRIEIRATLGENDLEIEVRDRGESVREPASEVSEGSSTPIAGFESGLSVPLLEGLVDGLSIDGREGGGNLVRMSLIRDSEEEAGL